MQVFIVMYVPGGLGYPKVHSAWSAEASAVEWVNLLRANAHYAGAWVVTVQVDLAAPPLTQD